ncbi:hypothetical protein RUESEDTHA_01578 [Ruegeria sp. THAF57]|uniref:amidohydrolase family protein n=1 Tax=Ruegeria sp. THAF57 TaxID=2744555 RepID=UPI0015DF91EA|nr:amidohydrolase [Ruegeria sp. THAF57]CAD0184696.1 hypothetical protein RUESEDTHA_01578 [Ruegeria sp. THAF57]
MLKRILILGAALFCSPAVAQERPIFDAHIHYSHDAVKLVPPEQVAKILRDAGVRKALVSSSDDNGTQLLLTAAPDIIVPALRPYRRRGEINTWMHDETVIDYLEENLAKNDYEAIGEFHAYGDDIKTPVVQRMIALAKERNLILHHHGDRAAVDLIFETWPEARVLWAHSGFDHPASVSDALDSYPRLWADLAFRSDMVSRGRLDPEWKAAFEAHPERFMVGTDTFAPERWYYVGPHADFSREWLDLLPVRIADNIAYANAERLLGSE